MIILNKMYSGKYLDQNIGHEFINEYTADPPDPADPNDHTSNNSLQYIYVNPKRPVKIKDKSEDNYTIQVRYVSKNCYEVISCAKIYKKTLNKIENGGKTLKYAGYTLETLLSKNTTNEEIYAHFKASEFKTCKPNTYICFGANEPQYQSIESSSDEETKVYLVGEFGKQNSRRYIISNDNSKLGGG